jgi:hypothetical protein
MILALARSLLLPWAALAHSLAVGRVVGCILSLACVLAGRSKISAGVAARVVRAVTQWLGPRSHTYSCEARGATGRRVQQAVRHSLSSGWLKRIASKISILADSRHGSTLCFVVAPDLCELPMKINEHHRKLFLY